MLQVEDMSESKNIKPAKVYHRTILLLILGFMSVFSVFAQDSNKVDSLRLLYEAEQIDSLKYKTLTLYEREVRKSDRVAALPLLKERVLLAEKIQKNNWLIKSYLALRNNYIYRDIFSYIYI